MNHGEAFLALLRREQIGYSDMQIEQQSEIRLSEAPEVDELRSRIINHLRHGSSAADVKHLWSGYLAALVEWGLIDRQRYVALSRLIVGIRTDELYHLFADEPMPAVGAR